MNVADRLNTVNTAAARCAVFGLLILFWIVGCGPSKEQVAEQARFVRAVDLARVDLHADHRDAIEILDKYSQDAKLQNLFVLFGMSETAAGMLGGNYAKAEQVAKHTHLAVQKYQDTESEKRAASGNEAAKFFKGEPHERAYLDFYAGLTCYIKRDYNNARIFFMQSLLDTATRDDDMKEYREDFALGHFWLGRAYLKLNQQDNARIAFQKAAARMYFKGEDKELEKIKKARTNDGKEERKGEALCYKNGSSTKQPVHGIEDLSKPVSRSEMPMTLPGAAESSPIEQAVPSMQNYLDVGYQKNINLILVVEMGSGPRKYAAGENAEFDEYLRVPRKEEQVDIYIDGHRAGPGFPLIEMYHQAVTRGVKTRRDRQGGKGLAKSILRRLPYVGDIAAYWDIGADIRHWVTLPGSVATFGARVKPGTHTISLKFFDAADAYLPRYDITRHYIPVPEQGEQVLLFYSLENQDNAYLLAQSPQP